MQHRRLYTVIPFVLPLDCCVRSFAISLFIYQLHEQYKIRTNCLKHMNSVLRVINSCTRSLQDNIGMYIYDVIYAPRYIVATLCNTTTAVLASFICLSQTHSFDIVQKKTYNLIYLSRESSALYLAIIFSQIMKMRFVTLL